MRIIRHYFVPLLRKKSNWFDFSLLIPRLVLVQALKFYETPQVRASDFANDLAVRQSRVGYDKSIIILCRFCNPTTMSKVENTIRAKLIGEIVTNYRELIHVKF